MEALPLLRLMQMCDSQFPVGAFAHSGGIETYSYLRFDAKALRDLLHNQVRLGWGRLDLATVSLAWRACRNLPALQEVCSEVTAHKVIPGQRGSSLRIGRRLVRLLERLDPLLAADLRLPEPHQAVILGAFGGRSGIPERDVLLGFAQSTVTASVGAATRAMPLSPEEAQEILSELQPKLVAQVDLVLDEPRRSFFAATPGLDVRCHQQAYLRTRLFQS